MKSVIVFKLCKDPRDAVVNSSGYADWGMATLASSDDDFRASEIARELGGEVIGLTIGNGDTAWAAARGASRTVLLKDVMPFKDAAATASVLAKAIQDIGDVDLVLIGDSSWDPAVPALLGAELGWTSLMGVLEVKEQDDALVAKRRTVSIEQEIEIAKPAVLGIVALSGEETPPGLKQVLMARKKPVEEKMLADLNAGIEETITVVDSALPDSTEATMISGETPEETVQKLLDVLRGEEVL